MPSPVPGLSVRRCNFEVDAGALAAIHASWTRGTVGVHVRSAERWRTWVPYVIGGANAATFCVEQVREDGGHDIVAYVAARHRRGVITLAGP